MGRERENVHWEDILSLPASGQHSLSDRVHEELSAAIVDGRLEAGEQLNDKAIAEALGISRTPVREALRRLTVVGLVEVAASRYTRVTEVTPEQAASTLEYAVLQAGNALQLAVGRMSETELTDAVALLDRMIEASDRDDADALVLSSREFVVFIIRHAGNPVLTRVLANENAVLERDLRRARVDLGTPEQRRGTYRRLRLAMLTRDADAAERCFRVQCGLIGAAGVGFAIDAAA